MTDTSTTLTVGQPKDYGIQILRVVFTLWILLYHSFNEYFLKNPFNIQPHYELEFMRGITNLVLQGFMFISGFLLAKGYFRKGKYRNRLSFVKDKAKRLLFPYLFWSLALVIFYNVPTYEVICGAKHLWFLLSLFDLMVLSTILLPAIVNSHKIIDFTIFMVVLFIPPILNKINLPYIFGLKTSIAYLPSFLLGIFIVKYLFDKRFIQMNRLRFGLLTSIIFVCAVTAVLSRSLPYGSLYLHLPYYFAPPILYILIIRTLHTISPMYIIDSIAANSLGIYILHQFVGKYTLMYYLPGYVEFYDHHYILAPTLLFFFMLLTAWGASKVMHKTKFGKFILGTS